MCECGPQVAGFAGAGNCVEWLGGVLEEVYVENCLGVGEFEGCKFGVEACLYGAEVRHVGCR